MRVVLGYLGYFSLVFSLLFLTGCQIPYLVNNAYQHLKIMNRRTPINEVIQKPNTSEQTKKKLLLALEARKFAENNLGLSSTDNYTSYVELDQPYITYVVSISPKNKLEYKLWDFPFVGKVPYKGYFKKQQALDEAKTFDATIYDSYVRGAGAYSTLGWFDDPILSSMMRYQDHDIVNTIIHETTHATLYIPDNADFNERLATFVGNKGTEIFYRKKEGDHSKTLEKIEQDNLDEKLFSEFISTEVKSLKTWYEGQNSPLDEKLRKARLKEINNRFETEVLPKLKTNRYKFFATREINNAKILSYKTYVYDLSDFDKAYKKTGNDFSKFIAYCKTLEKEENPEEALRKFVQ